MGDDNRGVEVLSDDEAGESNAGVQALSEDEEGPIQVSSTNTGNN